MTKILVLIQIIDLASILFGFKKVTRICRFAEGLLWIVIGISMGPFLMGPLFVMAFLCFWYAIARVGK